MADSKAPPPPAAGTCASKTVYLIRHAQSEENRRLQSLSNIASGLLRFSLPSSHDVSTSMELLDVGSQIDSPLSAKGQQQIECMADIVAKANFVETSGIELIVHSPLQRAKLTSEGIFQYRNENDSLKDGLPYRVIESALLLEKTPSEWIPGNGGALYQRISDLEDWILQQPESKIALVGHSQFFKAMLNLDYKFANVDVWKVQIAAAAAAPKEEEQSSTELGSSEGSWGSSRPTLWFGLEHMYSCTGPGLYTGGSSRGLSSSIQSGKGSS